MDLRQWDPTTGWEPTHLDDIVVDLSAATINDVPLGAPLQQIAGWGRAENAFPLYSDDKHHVIGGTWYYEAVGLAVSAVDGRIESWDVDVEPVPPARRRFRWRGGDVPITDVMRILGEPASRRGSDRVYPSGGWECVLEVSPQGRLQSISLQETNL
ncbi:MAG TPA: hypothetical protein VGO93_20875 [Candidatus Xenobia bacterium]|jgi:hypothetical protein